MSSGERRAESALIRVRDREATVYKGRLPSCLVCQRTLTLSNDPDQRGVCGPRCWRRLLEAQREVQS